MNGDIVYRKSHYIIIKVKNGFIVYNTEKEWNANHTHIKTFNQCKWLIDCAVNKIIPRTSNTYLLTSFIRIVNDDKLINQVKEFINKKEKR